MRSRSSITGRAVAVLAVAFALAMPAALAGAKGQIDPNLVDAFGRLNLTQADAQQIIDRSWSVSDPAMFQFAAALDDPSISPDDAPWAVPTRIGLTWASWPADQVPSFPSSAQVINNALYIPHNGPTAGTEYALMWAQMGAPVPIQDPMELWHNSSFPIGIPGQPTWNPLSQFPYDTWGGASVIPYLTYGPQPWSLDLSVVQQDGSLADIDFSGFGLIANDMIIVAVDVDSLLPNGPDGLTYSFAFHTHDGGYGASPSSRSLVTYATGTPGNLLPYVPGDLLVVGSTVLATTSTSSTSTSSTTTTTTAGTEPSDDDTTVGVTDDGENLESGSFRVWVPIVIIIGGLVITIGGYWVYQRTRERGRTTGGPTAPRDHHQNCDWALYFNDGGKRTVLRPAKGHECCVYDIEVRTTVPVVEMASIGRQDDDNPQGEDISPDQRLRMFDYDGWADGVDVGAYAATRTGPAGTQDWMHGLGDPRFEAGWKSTDEGTQHVQQKPLEERVDAGVSLRWEAKTTISATLTPDCPDYENTYELEASGNVGMAATSECTNGEPGPECPVELNTSGIVDASVSGDLNYPLVMKAATYPDELERKAPGAPDGPVGGIDSHDHATRPRSDWEDSDSNSGGVVLKQDVTSFELTSLLHIDSGQIVPMETWDTTERVTTDIQADLDHTAGLTGEMDTDCDQGCGGHGECLCAPKFELKVVGGKGTLEVDGETHKIQSSRFTDEWVLS